MKAMYNQPTTEVTALMPMSICDVSPQVNHKEENGQTIE